MSSDATNGTLHHIEMNVDDLESAIEFYDWFLGRLGYSVYQRWAQGRSWRLGSTYIVVVKVDPRYKEPSFHRRRVGLNHLAFHAPSQEAVDGMRALLEGRGVPILYGGPESGDDYYALFFDGPERLKLEYVWQKRPLES